MCYPFLMHELHPIHNIFHDIYNFVFLENEVVLLNRVNKGTSFTELAQNINWLCLIGIFHYTRRNVFHNIRMDAKAFPDGALSFCSIECQCILYLLRDTWIPIWSSSSKHILLKETGCQRLWKQRHSPLQRGAFPK